MKKIDDGGNALTREQARVVVCRGFNGTIEQIIERQSDPYIKYSAIEAFELLCRFVERMGKLPPPIKYPLEEEVTSPHNKT